MKLICAHADTCLPDYWGGHHLPHIQSSVTNETAIEELRTDLLSELNQDAVMGDCSSCTEEWYTAAKNAINAITSTKPKPFTNLENSGEDEEIVYAYFVFIKED